MPATTPATLNIRPQRRADYVLRLVLKDGDGVALNLAGYSIYASVWNKDRDTKYGDFVSTIISTATGTVELKMGYAVTATLPLSTSGHAYYDVMLVDPSGNRTYVLEGLVRASEGYTTP